MVEQVFERVAWTGGAIEDTADDDRIVCGVVVAEGTLGVMLAPREVRPAHEAAEEAQVERVKDLFKMVVAAFRAEIALGAARGADQLRLARNSSRVGETLIAKIVYAVDRFAVELRQQDMGDRVQDGFGRAFEKVGEADEYLAFTQADRCIQ